MKKLYVKTFEQYTAFNENKRNIDTDLILQGYLESICFTEEGKEDNFTDGDWNVHNFNEKSIEKSKKEIEKFIKICGEDEIINAIDEIGEEEIGRNLWYARQGHGTGFFDEDGLSNSKTLTKASKELKEVNGVDFDSEGKLDIW